MSTSSPPTHKANASVIIPAHNEASVIARTLEPLASAAEQATLDIVVVCNGCTDGTAAAARRFPGVRVFETAVASKTHALNLGDEVALATTRVYLDADVVASVDALLALVSLLQTESVLAARLSAEYDVSGATWLVRAYFRARSRIPSLHRCLWGAGNYGLSRTGRARLGRFPDITGDDLWVDRQFSAEEKRVLAGVTPVIVRVPRSLRALMAITRRNVSGAQESVAGRPFESTARRTLVELLSTARTPMSFIDAVVYSMVAVAARRGGRRHQIRWERDDSSRR